MSVSYYDALLPVREPAAGLPGVVAGIRLPYLYRSKMSRPV
jgi:hypothetical protein